MSRVAADGDAKSALSIMRREVPGLVAALRELVDEHLPEERKLRKVPQWTVLAQGARAVPDADQGSRGAWSGEGHNTGPHMLEHSAAQVATVR